LGKTEKNNRKNNEKALLTGIRIAFPLGMRGDIFTLIGNFNQSPQAAGA